MPRKRSIAFASCSVLLETLTFATPCTLSGMPPFEYAPCDAQLDQHVREVHAIDDLDQRDADAAAALDDAIADDAVVGPSLRWPPEKISTSFGGQM